MNSNYTRDLLSRNDRLVKAAPKMLETLKFLQQAIHQAYHDGLQIKCIRHTCNAITCAIYEAEGGQAVPMIEPRRIHCPYGCKPVDAELLKYVKNYHTALTLSSGHNFKPTCCKMSRTIARAERQ